MLSDLARHAPDNRTKRKIMKHTKIYSTLCLLIFGLMTISLQAQFDDLYFNPETDYPIVSTTTSYNEGTDSQQDDYTSSESRENYDDEYYDHMNEYDFYYSSRIRRFQRPNRGFGFYDPFYVDYHYYDPFFSPGLTIYIGSGWNPYSPWGFRNNRWGNNFGFNRFGNHWGFNDPWCPSFNSFGSPWGYNPYGWGGGNLFVNNYYYGGGGGWSNPWNYDNDNQFTRIYEPSNANNRGTYYGPRSTGMSRTTDEGRSSRLQTGNEDNYDRYPNSRRQPRTTDDGTTGRSRTPDRDSESASPYPGAERGVTPRERSRNNIENTGRNGRVDEAPERRRSIFSPRNNSAERRSNSIRENNNTQRQRSRSYDRPSRSSRPDFNRSESPRRSSPSNINNGSRSRSSSSGVNRSSGNNSRSSGSSRSSRSSRGGRG